MLKVLFARVVVATVLIVDAEIRRCTSRAIANLLAVDVLDDKERLRVHVNAESDDIILAVSCCIPALLNLSLLTVWYDRNGHYGKNRSNSYMKCPEVS